MDSISYNFYYEKGAVDELSPCPGRYCGRSLLANGSWSACGACERGTRRNASSACDPCSDTPSLYDWLYLGNMMLVPLVLHLLSVDYGVKKYMLPKQCWVVYCCVGLEIIVSSFMTLLITPPFGQLSITSCNPRELFDWYPIMHNPNPNYEGYLHCTQEAVYPIYTMVLVAYSLLLVAVLTLRPLASKWLARANNTPSKCLDIGAVYAALYLLPALSVIHALFAGILYYVFPFLIIIGSVISIAAYFAHKGDQTVRQLVLGCVRNSRSILILLGHWCLHAYGIIALTIVLTNIREPRIQASLCALVPLPTLFYILTARFSDPAMIPMDGVRPTTPLSRASVSLAVNGGNN